MSGLSLGGTAERALLADVEDASDDKKRKDADGSIDDGYDGLLAWMWVVAAASTLALLGATWKCLQERFYAAVMAATGLLYLAILTAFGTDLIARAVLS